MIFFYLLMFLEIRPEIVSHISDWYDYMEKEEIYSLNLIKNPEWLTQQD